LKNHQCLGFYILRDHKKTNDFYKFYDILDDIAEEFGAQKWILELYGDGKNMLKPRLIMPMRQAAL